MHFDPIFFDLDGTLTDSAPGITRCVQYALRSFGITETDPARLRRFIGPPLVTAFMDYYGFSEQQARAATEKYRERYRDTGIFENRVYDGILPMLTGLKAQGRTLAVATGKPTLFTNRILEHFGLAGFFSAVLGTEFDGRRSDKAEVIEELLEQFGIPDGRRSSVLIVGDRRHDIAAAKKCGIASLGVLFGFAEPGELEAAGADFICRTTAETADFLLSH
ncbi:MAG: HAD hydrolase-like protein [Firmicutes bacterium]|nr:HAD hydrolase-like protein [Bacillota bacterium]